MIVARDVARAGKRAGSKWRPEGPQSDTCSFSRTLSDADTFPHENPRRSSEWNGALGEVATQFRHVSLTTQHVATRRDFFLGKKIIIKIKIINNDNRREELPLSLSLRPHPAPIFFFFHKKKFLKISKNGFAYSISPSD